MDIQKIWELLKGLCAQADQLIPGATGKEKKAWCIDKVADLVDAGEIMIGIAGWANLPLVNGFERWIIGLGVERAWTELQLPND